MSEDSQPVEVKRGDRGELGQGTPGSRLKTLWHEKKCPGSLKEFVRSLTDNPDAKTWRANKLGKNNKKRSDANLKRAREEAQATRLAKRKRAEKGSK